MLSGESRHGAPELREEGGWLGGERRAPAVVSHRGFPFKLLPRQYDLSSDALLPSPPLWEHLLRWLLEMLLSSCATGQRVARPPGDKAGMGVVQGLLNQGLILALGLPLRVEACDPPNAGNHTQSSCHVSRPTLRVLPMYTPRYCTGPRHTF